MRKQSLTAFLSLVTTVFIPESRVFLFESRDSRARVEGSQTKGVQGRSESLVSRETERLGGAFHLTRLNEQVSLASFIGHYYVHL